jgi:plastocyanin
MPRTLPLLFAVLVVCALAPAAAHAGISGATVASVEYPGMQHLHYKYGPIDITPGQNTIEFRPNDLKPDVPGYITRFEPNLIRMDGSVPRVDVLHLHHGVWIMRNYPTFAVGEEKTIAQFPDGFGYRYDPKDPWIMNYMLHNLEPSRDKVYITYDIDFVPMDSPAAAGITEIKPLWMDVAGISTYPVFNVLRGQGKNGKYTFPNDATGTERSKIGGARQFTADKEMTLVSTAGHLHPGGLYTDLKASRAGQTTQLFRSDAKYFEPAGAVSWDVAMTGTKPGWRVAVNPGDRLNVSATYDSRRASWYESMGIMVLWVADGHVGGAVDPFTTPVDWHGELTHGHLSENDNHGGGIFGLPDARKLLAGSQTTRVDIRNFVFGHGDLSLTGTGGRPPKVRAGRSLTFRNLDSSRTIYHTITACKAPCNKATGIAYPLADANVAFDSGELGFGPRFATAAANRQSWQTPKNLRPGTYNYFCRIHPFMRGSFRVVAR